ncbi:hypothetical protein SAMN05216420_101310 [Nitrosospira sp. Nl5]|uniref:hypothetical protein n=1 Tax=Nitrosospira sp. Nl5 TaxID=200120 RepID=UPI00088A979C|nr:hypothetical protein [Nitrosospira sp. Nl5]SCX91165.1 hypothetical protein SAMN05216420_101310 [Nitrosospira sp. Nl5]
MTAKPKRASAQAGRSTTPHAAQSLIPISLWKSDAIGVTAYVYEEPEAAIRQSGLVPEWVGYPTERPGSGIAVPAHHFFPNYLKLLRLQSGRLRLIIDARAVLRADGCFQCFIDNLLADPQLSLVKGEPV